MPRLFVAIEPPEEERERLDELCDDLPEARWTQFDQLHLTLAFIGEVDFGRARDVDEGLAALTDHGFDLGLRSVGHFPPRGEPRILWAGFAPSEPLMTLQRHVMRALEHAGCEVERRKFHPHVTLARLVDASHVRVAAWLAARSAFSGPSFAVRELHLLSSVLGRAGATHRIEATYELREPEPGP